jgi:hypothetical protein
MSDIIKKLEILYKELSRIRAEIVFLESQNKDVNDMIFNYIVKTVCEKENILYNDLISSCKKQNLAFSRMMISKLTYENSGFNLSKIAKLLGNKNHSTIIYGIKTITVNDIIVHTFKIKVKNNDFNSNILTKYGFTFVLTSNNYIVITETTLDNVFFNNQVNKLGKVLKSIAFNNVDEKYIWVN